MCNAFKSDNIKSTIIDEADEFIEELFKSLPNRHQNNYPESIKSSEFIFNYVHFLYYKCHKINPNCVGSYINSPDWTENKKSRIDPINKKDNKCFQYAVTITLNQGKTGKCSETITKIKSFINKYNFFHQKKMIGKKLGKIMEQLLLIFCMLKKKKYILLMFQNINYVSLQLWKTSYSFNDSRWSRMALYYNEEISWRRLTSKHHSNFYCLNFFHSLTTESKRESQKRYVKIKIFVTL